METIYRYFSRICQHLILGIGKLKILGNLIPSSILHYSWQQFQAAISKKEKEREENREIVRVIFDVIRHLAKQNNAFRGHDESDAAENRGNFLEELKFLAKYHQPLQKWI